VNLITIAKNVSLDPMGFKYFYIIRTFLRFLMSKLYVKIS